MAGAYPERGDAEKIIVSARGAPGHVHPRLARHFVQDATPTDQRPGDMWTPGGSQRVEFTRLTALVEADVLVDDEPTRLDPWTWADPIATPTFIKTGSNDESFGGWWNAVTVGGYSLNDYVVGMHAEINADGWALDDGAYDLATGNTASGPDHIANVSRNNERPNAEVLLRNVIYHAGWSNAIEVAYAGDNTYSEVLNPGPWTAPYVAPVNDAVLAISACVLRQAGDSGSTITASGAGWTQHGSYIYTSGTGYAIASAPILGDYVPCTWTGSEGDGQITMSTSLIKGR